MSIRRNSTLVAIGLTAMLSLPTAALAQSFELKGVKNHMRYDDGEDTKSTYVGWDEEQGKAIFTGDVGLWKLSVNENTVQSELAHYDNLMYGNSGSVYVNGNVYTFFSHAKEDGAEGEMEFVVRKWNVENGELLSTQRFPKSANLESRGLAFNHVDGKVYGLFYITDAPLPGDESDIDPEDKQEGMTTDAGYAIGTIDLNTMQITQITPGLYYDNFVTLTCSPDGRLFSMTAGGTLVEFDAATGLMKTQTIVNDEGEEEQVSTFGPSGVVSQFKRQAACFDFHTGKMYWNGFVNSGMGYNDWGSYGPLSDKEWRTNGKYDTALYEIDTNTGKATLISKIPNRISFSCLWVVGADASDVPTGIKEVSTTALGRTEVYNLSGQLVYTGQEQGVKLPKGIYIIKNGKETKKVYINVSSANLK